MTTDIQYHTMRVLETLKSARLVSAWDHVSRTRALGDMIDKLAYEHARDAAHAARRK